MAKKPAYIPSATMPNKKYLVVYDDESQTALWCNCPAFSYKNPAKRPCKHMIAFKIPKVI